jgi:hypothetical protein
LRSRAGWIPAESQYFTPETKKLGSTSKNINRFCHHLQGIQDLSLTRDCRKEHKGCHEVSLKPELSYK